MALLWFIGQQTRLTWTSENLWGIVKMIFLDWIKNWLKIKLRSWASICSLLGLKHALCKLMNASTWFLCIDKKLLNKVIIFVFFAHKKVFFWAS